MVEFFLATVAAEVSFNLLLFDLLSFDVLSFWEDDVSPTPLLIVPRPKVGWTNRKVTFVGKKI